MIKPVLLSMIGLYKRAVSPLLPPVLGIGCRFYPTCSDYARDCLEKYPLTVAVARSTTRLLRCQPWNDGGVDLP